MKPLRLAPGLDLPADVGTRTWGILGQRGTGKTNTATALVEEIVGHDGFAAVLDPVGAWYGITRAGKGGPGLPGIVLGGEHGDVPLEETGGQLVADFIAGRHYPVVVVDMKLLRKGAQLRFMADFLETLFHSNRKPLHLVFEEADRALPQTLRGGDVVSARVLGAGEDIVKLGRSRGLGATLVTQRPATVNKNVLEQVEGLIVHQLIGPNDRKAIKTWIEANGDPKQTAAVMDSIASLKMGEAWIYAPRLEMLQRAKIRERRTFDSSATPDEQTAAAAESRRRHVDLDELRTRMAATIERAKANDPKELKKRIAELEWLVKDSEKYSKSIPAAKVERVEVPVPSKGQLEKLETIVDSAVQRIVRPLTDAIDKWGAAAREELKREISHPPRATERPAVRVAPSTPRGENRRSTQATHAASGSGNGKLGKAERSILSALSQYPDGRSKRQVALLAGYAMRGGAFGNALSRLRTLGLVEGSQPIRITDSGMEHGSDPLPTGPALLDHWMGQLGAAEREILRVLCEAFPARLHKDEIAAKTVSPSTGAPYEPAGGAFGNALSRLRTLELISGRSDLIAAAELFG